MSACEGQMKKIKAKKPMPVNESPVTMSELIELSRKVESDLKVTSNSNSQSSMNAPPERLLSQPTLNENNMLGARASPKVKPESHDRAPATTSGSSNSNSFVPPANWANAPEFVPRFFVPAVPPTSDDSSPERSYAQVAGAGVILEDTADSTSTELCPYAMVGECRYGEQCCYIHGLKCEFCGMDCLHPFDPPQREKHSRECVEQHEKDMELSFAVARSSEKTCGICMEVVMEKQPPGEQRFGILPSCIHCFCLSCIRKWRQARQFENKIIRACPECRVTSDYVCPSRFWVESKEEKDKLIQSYLNSLSQKPCRYYKNGGGECPFGNKCFYLHALSDGQVVDVGPPRRKIRRQNANGVSSDNPGVSIWEFLEQWELQWFEIEDLMDMMDSDDNSIWSDQDEEDYEGYFELVASQNRSQ